MTKQKCNDSFSPNKNLWLSVKKDIEAKIITGEYAVGSKIPTIVEFGEQYNIGKTTVQKVITALYDEGTIVKRVGSGCFVKPFVREKLLKRHKHEFEMYISRALDEAFLLGLDEDYVRNLIDEKWKQHNK